MDNPDFSASAAPDIGVPRLLVTEGGLHPPEKWAEAVAADVVRAPGPAGAELRRVMAAALAPVFGLASRWDVQTLTREGVGRVIRCVSDSPWSLHFVRSEREADLTDILMRHLTMARDTELQHAESQGRR